MVCNPCFPRCLPPPLLEGRNPLTGLSGLQLRRGGWRWPGCTGWSRNPLTGLSGLQPRGLVANVGRLLMGRNPLTGLSGLQLYPPKNAVLDSTAGGGFVRKMKLGICIGQRVGVLRGLGRWEGFGRGVKGECISEYRRPRGKKLVFKVPSRISGTRTL